jgi:uncharacterized RDD family membrane protein YckC
MSDPNDALRAEYASYETQYLLELAREGGLTDAATTALRTELASRDVDLDVHAHVSTSATAERSVRTRDEAWARTDSRQASLLARLAAKVIDQLIAFVPAMFVAALALPGHKGIFWLAAAMAFAYTYLADGMANGQSIGKGAMGIAVVDLGTGRPCTYLQSIIRNVILTVIGLIDLCFLLGAQQRRLGDRVAGTVVVRAP